MIEYLLCRAGIQLIPLDQCRRLGPQGRLRRIRRPSRPRKLQEELARAKRDLARANNHIYAMTSQASGELLDRVYGSRNPWEYLK